MTDPLWGAVDDYWAGVVLPPDPVQGIRRFADALRNDRRVDATAIQTVGAKSHDGFLYAVVRP